MTVHNISDAELKGLIVLVSLRDSHYRAQLSIHLGPFPSDEARDELDNLLHYFSYDIFKSFTDCVESVGSRRTLLPRHRQSELFSPAYFVAYPESTLADIVRRVAVPL